MFARPWKPFWNLYTELAQSQVRSYITREDYLLGLGSVHAPLPRSLHTSPLVRESTYAGHRGAQSTEYRARSTTNNGAWINRERPEMHGAVVSAISRPLCGVPLRTPSQLHSQHQINSTLKTSTYLLPIYLHICIRVCVSCLALKSLNATFATDFQRCISLKASMPKCSRSPLKWLLCRKMLAILINYSAKRLLTWLYYLLTYPGWNWKMYSIYHCWHDLVLIKIQIGHLLLQFANLFNRIVLSAPTTYISTLLL